MALELLAPVPLNTEHRLSDFNCGESSLNDWLKRRALANQHNGASRDCKIFCVNGYWLQRDSVTVHDNKLCHGRFPVSQWHCPFFRYLM